MSVVYWSEIETLLVFIVPSYIAKLIDGTQGGAAAWQIGFDNWKQCYAMARVKKFSFKDEFDTKKPVLKLKLKKRF